MSFALYFFTVSSETVYSLMPLFTPCWEQVVAEEEEVTVHSANRANLISKRLKIVLSTSSSLNFCVQQMSKNCSVFEEIYYFFTDEHRNLMRNLWIGLLFGSSLFMVHLSSFSMFPAVLSTGCVRGTAMEGKSLYHLARKKRTVRCGGKVISLVNIASALSSACFGVEFFCCPF